MNKPKGTRRNGGEGGGKRRSRAERAQWVSEYRASGLTQERFAAERGLKLATLRNWIYKPAAPEGEAGHFVPVQIIGPRAAGSGGKVTVRWPQGVEVELPVDLDGGGVVQLLRDLLGQCLR